LIFIGVTIRMIIDSTVLVLLITCWILYFRFRKWKYWKSIHCWCWIGL